MKKQSTTNSEMAIDNQALEAEVTALLRHAPQQERSVQRVNLILATADALFAEVGYDSVTTNQIAAQAGIPIGSLYQFFSDKEIILQALAVRYRAGLLQLLDRQGAHNGSISAAAEQFLDTLFHFGGERWGFTRILLLEGASPETRPAVDHVRQTLVQQLQQVIAPYLPHLTATDQEEVATIVMTAFQALLAYAVTLKYTQEYSRGYAAMERAFTQTKLMISAYLEQLV